MVEILDQTTAKSATQMGSKLQHISMVSIVKIAYDMKIVKIAKLTKIYDGNLKSGLERGLQLLYIPLIRYIQDFYCESGLMWRS